MMYNYQWFLMHSKYLATPRDIIIPNSHPLSSCEMLGKLFFSRMLRCVRNTYLRKTLSPSICSARKLSSTKMVHILLDQHNPEETALEAPYLKLYTFGTPNGRKVSTLLELLHLDYHVHSLDITKNESKQDWFLKINPNGRIPTLTEADSNGNQFSISESGAILLYLADKYDKDRKFSYAYGTKEYYEELEWLMFQMAGVGPMTGQANHFVRFTKEDIPYAKKRYLDEVRRLCSVLEERLERNPHKALFLVGDHLSLADIATYPWIYGLKFLDIDVNDYPKLAQWAEQISKIEEVKKGMSVP